MTKNPTFIRAVSRPPQRKSKRRRGSQAYSDAALAVAWLNDRRVLGSGAQRRVLAVLEELTQVARMLDDLLRQKTALRKLRPDTTEEEQAEQVKKVAAFGVLHTGILDRAKALNERLARYTFIPKLDYDLGGARWAFGTVPKRSSASEPVVTLSSGPFDVRVTEATVVAALARLATSYGLGKVRLCEQCKKRWLVSERQKRDRFCSRECREKNITERPGYLDRRRAIQQRYRDTQKRLDAQAKRVVDYSPPTTKGR